MQGRLRYLISRSYYRRRFGNLEDDDVRNTIIEKELEVGFWLGLLIGLLIGFFLCAALMAWHALTYDFIDGEWKRREAKNERNNYHSNGNSVIFTGVSAGVLTFRT